MNVMDARIAIDELANDFIAIGESVSEKEFREAYAKMISKKKIYGNL